MTDTQNVIDWQSRLTASQHSNPVRSEAPVTTPEISLQRNVNEWLVTLRGHTAQILNMRDEAARRAMESQAIGSRAGRLLGLFANPFEGDKRTTTERQQTETEIRRELIDAESQQGGSRLFGINKLTGQQENWFGIDANGNAVWVRQEAGQAGDPGQARVTTYYYGLEPQDPIFKVQSVQDATGTNTPEQVSRTLLTVRELQNLTTSVTRLHDIAKTLYGAPADIAHHTSATPLTPAVDIHGLSAPVDDSRLSLAA
jgi:hypothetical protein